MTARAVFRLEMLHVSAREDLPVVSRVYEVTRPRVRVPRRCPDCNAVPETVPPAPGYQSCVLFIHETSCPWLGRAVQADEGGDL